MSFVDETPNVDKIGFLLNQHFSYDKTDRVKKVRRNEKPWRHKPKKPKDGDLTSSMHRL